MVVPLYCGVDKFFMKNHAFLFTAHKQPDLLARTLRILAQDNHYFYIHVDAKTTDFNSFREAMAGIVNVTFVERIPMYHSGISHLYCDMNLLKEVMFSKVHFDYIHKLSGQDYPLRSNQQFDDFFELTDHSFMCFDAGEFKQSMLPVFHKMVNHYHSNRSGTLSYKFFEGLRLGRILSYIWRRPPIENFASGWDWFSWSEPVYRFVFEELERNKSLIKRFNYTITPTEHIYHTILSTQIDKLKIETDNPLRYVSWHPHRPVESDYRPYILNELDFEYVIRSKAFFCRKVDEFASSKLLDMIDACRGQSFDINNAKSVIE